MDIKIGAVYTLIHVFRQADFDQFAVLSGDDNPIHIDPDFAAHTRFGQTVAHGMLLYSTVCGVLGTHFPGPGTVQLEHEMTFLSPTFVGEEICIRIEVTQTNPETRLVEMNTRVIRPNNDLGLDGKTLVQLSGKSKPWIWQSTVLPQHKGEEGESFKGLKIGQSAELRRSFTRENLLDYASISSDSNPLFIDPDYVKKTGYKNLLVPGGLLGGLFSCLLGTQLPGRGTNWLKQRLTFPAPAYIEEPITAKVEIIKLRPEKDLVNLRTVCSNSENTIVCEGESLVYVKDLE